MFYFLDIEKNGDMQKHIIKKINDDSIMSFPLTDDNPNTTAYLAWVAEGNEAQTWE